jgi:large subunit ribosomal protein L23
MNDSEARQLIISPVITEKGTVLQEANNQYLFRVDVRANKIRIAAAIAKIFKVEVTGVRTLTVHGKMRRIGRAQGRRPSWKKAIVTLKDGDTIDLS